MTGVLEYIKGSYPGNLFSRVFYISSANGVAQASHNTQGARAIVYGYLYWASGNGGTTISFKDQYGAILFQTVDNFNSNTYVPIPYVIENAKVKITCSLNTIPFTISYQYLFAKDK